MKKNIENSITKLDKFYSKNIEKPLNKFSFYFTFLLALIFIVIGIRMFWIGEYNLFETGFVLLLGLSVLFVIFWNKKRWIKDRNW